MLQVVFAIQARKTALENLVRLLGMDYFSGPVEPYELKRAQDIAQEKKEEITERQVRQRIRRT
jgi:hypothetical protein